MAEVSAEQRTDKSEGKLHYNAITTDLLLLEDPCYNYHTRELVQISPGHCQLLG